MGAEDDIRRIERLGARYAAAIDDRDFVGLAACFAEAGIWAGPSGERRGRMAIAAFAEAAVGPLAATQHLATNFLVRLDGEQATMRSTFVAAHVGGADRAGDIFTIGGRYDDAMVREGGEWLILRRDIVPLWSTGNPEVMAR